MSSPNLTREEARERAELISDLSYEVSLDLTRGEETFGCWVVIRFRSPEPGSATFLNFVGRAVERGELNGAAIGPDAYDGTRIRIGPLAAENELRIEATCEYQHTGVGMHRFRDPVDGLVYMYSDAEPFDIHRIYPCFDQPDLKARFEFSVVAPEGWEVVSNVPATSRPAAGEGGRWTFERTPPMSTYITAVVAGPYHVARTQHRNLELGLYCRQSLAQFLETDEIFEVTKQGFDFFEQAFDYSYAFGSKYDQVFVPEFNSGAMENVGCVTFHEDYLFRSKVTDAARERRAETILHEMAHMWFGDLVTMRWWDDLWLNESFASWAAVYAQAKATRWDHAWVTFADSEKTWAYRQDQLSSTHPIVADIPDIAATKVNFDGITYAKGASVLRQLVAWVGEEAFLAGIRAYFRRHEFANTTLQDFLSALEEASGRDLGVWSKEWLETAGVNTLRPRIETAPLDGDQAIASLWVEQEAAPEHPTLRSHRIGIGLFDEGSDGIRLRRGVEHDIVGRATQVDLSGERVPDLMLLNNGDLTFAKIRLDDRSVNTIVERLADVRDSLARALCWSAAWDMTRDAEIPARLYLELVLRNIHGETVIPVVQSLLAQASSAASLYGNLANRPRAIERLASAAGEAIPSAEPGSDHQLVWARSFIAHARTDAHLAIVRGLLDGSASFEGLAVDTDVRWLIVRSLAAAGTADEGLIAAEESRDPTDKGTREAATARASIPTPAAKEEAWRLIVEDTALPFATMRALVGGFQRLEQEHLMEPFVARYFETLGPFWESRNLEECLAFAHGLYPRVLVSEDTIRATDDYIAAQSPTPALRRVLMEGRDDIERAMRTRSIDASSASQE